MSTVITVENLSKKYIIGHQKQERDGTLRDALANGAKRLGAKFRHPFATQIIDTQCEEFWALKNISFEIKQGDRVGVIGCNGAGKSTLLKILSRITEPTSGKAMIKGRVASLLEVGTGFHPELTGRENVYLNGAILGMSKAEIKSRFDEIVAFAEVERFLDTPVKRYSSGMYVRLAFAVAAYLEPEILIVDEVLAVGDAQFQKKCLGKMEEVGKEGRTVIFVSHNIQAIRQLCSNAILLESGTLAAFDSSQKVTSLYFQKNISGVSRRELHEKIDQLPTDTTFRLESIQMSQMGQDVFEFVKNGDPLEVCIRYDVKHHVNGLRVFIDMQDDQGVVLFRSFHDEDNNEIPAMVAGSYSSKVTIPANMMAAMPHLLCVRAGIFGVRYTLPEEGICIPFQVEQSSRYNRAYPEDRFVGRLALVLDWDTKKLAGTAENV
jgi:lipopolysaccharide transport system ATP-binding protein